METSTDATPSAKDCAQSTNSKQTNANLQIHAKDSRHEIYYNVSTHAHERLVPIVLSTREELAGKLEGLIANKESQEKYLVGMPAKYKTFSRVHHPTNPYHLAQWHISLFAVQYGKLSYVGNELERAAGLGLLCDEFISLYFNKMDKVNWENEDGSPIEKPLTHILDAFDEWRAGAEKELLDDTGFPKVLGKYNDCLWAAWESRKIRWDFENNCQLNIRETPPCCFDNLTIRGIVPYFPPKDKISSSKLIDQKAGSPLFYRDHSELYTPPEDEEQRQYDIGFPLPYANFSPSHHPTNMMHLALWSTSFSEWEDKWGEGIRYEGPYVDRAEELQCLCDDFIVMYLKKMDSLGWANPDGTPIGDALKHILDAFEDWRNEEIANPADKRSCDFNDAGFPLNRGRYVAFLKTAWTMFDSYYLSYNGFISWDEANQMYDALAFRGLVCDCHKTREIAIDQAPDFPWLFSRLFDDDESLVPPGFEKLVKPKEAFKETESGDDMPF